MNTNTMTLFANEEEESFTVDYTKRLVEGSSKLNKVLIIKFSADWCKPCKIIAPYVDKRRRNMNQSHIYWGEVDIDESMDLYMFLKNKRMVSGIPTMLAWFPNPDRDQTKWYIPDDSISGTDISKVGEFFDRCFEKSLK